MAKIAEQIVVYNGSNSADKCSATFPDVCVMPSGRILVSWRGGPQKGPINIGENGYYCISDDGGKTWSEIKPMGVKGAPPHLFVHSSGALICSFGRRCEPFGEFAWVSYDEGETWAEEYAIDTNASDGDLGYPATVELEDGSLLSVYYQKVPGDEKTSLLYTNWNLKK